MLEIEGLKLYTYEEIAEKLSVTTRTVQNYTYTGGMKKTIINKRVYISEEALKDYLNGKK